MVQKKIPKPKKKKRNFSLRAWSVLELVPLAPSKDLSHRNNFSQDFAEAMTNPAVLQALRVFVRHDAPVKRDTDCSDIGCSYYLDPIYPPDTIFARWRSEWITWDASSGKCLKPEFQLTETGGFFVMRKQHFKEIWTPKRALCKGVTL